MPLGTEFSGFFCEQKKPENSVPNGLSIPVPNGLLFTPVVLYLQFPSSHSLASHVL